MTYIEMLAGFRSACINDMQTLADGLAADESRSAFNDDEQPRWDQLERWVADADAELVRHEKLTELAAQQPAEARGDKLPTAPNVNTRGSEDPFDLRTLPYNASAGELRGRARTAIERMSHADDEAREAAMSTLERNEPGKDQRAVARHMLATGSEAYRSAFFKQIAGQGYAITGDEARALDEARAASLTGNAGGFAVPFTLDPTIILTNDGTANSIRQISRRVQITTDQWNGVSSAGVTASWDGEVGEVSDDAPTLAQPSIDAEKAQAFVPFSIEVGMDWQSMDSDVAMLFADAKDRLEGAAFATGAGSGSNQPTGIVTELAGGASEISSATTDTFAVADVYSTFETTPPRHRSRGSWLANIGIINDIRQFATANNYHGFTVDLTAAGIPQLLGSPVYETSDMDGTVNATADNYVLIHGDFSQYVVVDRIGMSVELVPHLFATGNNRPSGQRGFYAFWRVGAGSVNDNAFTLLNVT